MYICPHCSTPVGTAGYVEATTKAKETQPEEGSITFCHKCYGYIVFTKENFRAATEEEVKGVNEDESQGACLARFVRDMAMSMEKRR